MSCVSETREKYEVAPSPSPVEHFKLYIWLYLDELGFERGLALRRRSILGKGRGRYQRKDCRPDLSAHLHPLHSYGLAIVLYRSVAGRCSAADPRKTF
jgi:hypothetical protein